MRYDGTYKLLYILYNVHTYVIYYYYMQAASSVSYEYTSIISLCVMCMPVKTTPAARSIEIFKG